ncbi:biotin carboxylase [Nocardiopsis arvandica]|uniref:Biotin carboxylase n=1 Tax=Nocardiopsis sinuspersici TaxID=501010 RepID=A0A7Z0BK88_9ACTN|nr:ATP-grasp domain-containing protein [Nocardiopsis sinuspersici]NYH52905.1 biotin carboxylase [Nocardiopsis sinuspersici]
MNSVREPGTLVIVHRVPVSITPLHEWLSEVLDRIVLITSTESADGYRDVLDYVIAVDDYPHNPAVVEHVDELCRTRRVERIVCGTEDDALRVAGARERWGIPGMTVHETLPYRDKLLMKDAVSTVVHTPRYTVPDSLGEAEEFAEQAGWPVVVKPRLGYGSRGVRVVGNADSLREELVGRSGDDLLLEEYVPGTVHHVDGFAYQGKVLWSVSSRYLNNCLSWQEGTSLGSAQTDPEDVLSKRLEAFAQAVAEVLPIPEPTPFHLEVFQHAKTSELYFCETAARTGGGHILDVLERATGMNCVREWYRSQCGLPHRADRPEFSSERFGFLLVPPRQGRLRSIADDYPVYADVRMNASPPQVFGPAAASTDTVMGLIVSGTSNELVEERLSSCMEWASRAMEWEAP